MGLAHFMLNLTLLSNGGNGPCGSPVKFEPSPILLPCNPWPKISDVSTDRSISAAGPLISDTTAPVKPVVIVPDPCAKFNVGMQWSYSGPVTSNCVQIYENADPHTWLDNYLCFNQDYGVEWSSSGSISTKRCTQVIEPSDPHTWNDNYICVPWISKFEFQWYYAGKPPNSCCVQVLEPSDPHTWTDNYLCLKESSCDVCTPFNIGMEWSYVGKVANKECVQINEPSDPNNWSDNYICFWKDYGVRWSFNGAIPGMTCTQIIEPSDPHAWGDNFLCVPKTSTFEFLWSNAGPIKNLCCIKIEEPSDPNTWNDNWLCLKSV